MSFSLVAYLLAGVFAVASVAKLANRSNFDPSFTIVGLTQPQSLLVWRVLPFLEAFVAVTLLVPIIRSIGAAIALLLGIAFVVVVGYAVVGGENFTCACFGSLSKNPVNLFTVLRNLMIIDAAFIVLMLENDGEFGMNLSNYEVAIGLSTFTIVTVGTIYVASVKNVGRKRVQSRRDEMVGTEFDPFLLYGSTLPDAIRDQLELNNIYFSNKEEIIGVGDTLISLDSNVFLNSLLLVFSQQGCYECTRLDDQFAINQVLSSSRITRFVTAGANEQKPYEQIDLSVGEDFFSKGAIKMSGYSMAMYPCGLLVSPRGLVVDVAVGTEAIVELARKLDAASTWSIAE